MDTQKENLCHLILTNVKFNSTNFKSNLTQGEKTALKELKSNDSTIKTQADKRGQFVILDKNHYIERLNELMMDHTLHCHPTHAYRN